MSDRTSTAPVRDTSDRSTLVNAFLGAVVSVVLAFLPFSPVLGGGVAGYLEHRDGVRVGAVSGAITALPLGLLLVVVMLLWSAFLVVPDPAVGGGLLLLTLVTLVGVALVALYTVVLSAVGGYLGVYVYEEFEGGRGGRDGGGREGWSDRGDHGDRDDRRGGATVNQTGYDDGLDD